MVVRLKNLGSLVAAATVAATLSTPVFAKNMTAAFENTGWIVEARIKDSKRAEFQPVMNGIIAAMHANEPGALNNQYYASEDDPVLAYERFSSVDSAMTHNGNRYSFAARWIAATDLTSMWHIGILPDDLRDNYAVLNAHNMQPFGGFAR